eukprot:359966-Chlamydomonas_euryale.AAC.1
MHALPHAAPHAYSATCMRCHMQRHMHALPHAAPHACGATGMRRPLHVQAWRADGDLASDSGSADEAGSYGAGHTGDSQGGDGGGDAAAARVAGAAELAAPLLQLSLECGLPHLRLAALAFIAEHYDLVRALRGVTCVECEPVFTPTPSGPEHTHWL